MPPKKYERTQKMGDWMTLDIGGAGKVGTAIRCLPLPDFEWLDQEIPSYDTISDYHVGVCPFGGPIAICRKETATISLFNSKGKVLAERVSVGNDPVIHLGWNEKSEHLIVVCRGGTIYFYTCMMASAAGSVKVDDPVLFQPLPNGLAMITADCRAITLECQIWGSGEYRTRSVELDGVEELPACFLAIPADHSESGYDELVIAASNENTLHKVAFSTQPKCVNKFPLLDGAIVAMALCPQGKDSQRKFGAVDTYGNVYLSDTTVDDVEKIYEITGLPEDEAPASFAWIGENCLCWSYLTRQFDEEELFDSVISFIDPNHPPNVDYGDEAEYTNSVPADFILYQEVDGCRLISVDQNIFVQEIPPCAYRVYRDLKSPAARLVTAYDQYMEEDSASVSTLRLLTQGGTMEKLITAINDSINSAALEFDIPQQQRLMRVANYGKSFCPTYDTDNFASMAIRLRVLNAMRRHGMNMTLEQYSALEGDSLTARLIQLEKYQLAFMISQHLGLPPDDVIQKWARKKITSQEPTHVIADTIVEKMKLCKGLSLRGIAEAAYHNGNEELAVRLLEADPYAENQVHVLLSIHYEDLALDKAVESGSGDLVFYVITQWLHVKGSAAVKAISKHPVAKDMLLTLGIVSKSTRDYLEEYYKGHPKYEAYLCLLNYLKQEERMVRNHIKPNKTAGSEMVQEFKASTVMTAQKALEKEQDPAEKATLKLLKQQSRLLELQQDYGNEYKNLEFLNASLSQTIQLLIAEKQVDKADKLRKDFGMNDKMYAWCKLRSLIKNKNWEEIDKMGGAGNFKHQKVKSPIGFSPFVTELVKVGEKERAADFIPRVPEIIERMELYCLAEAWQEACADCIKNKEFEMIDVLKDRARHDPRAVELMERQVRQYNL